MKKYIRTKKKYIKTNKIANKCDCGNIIVLKRYTEDGDIVAEGEKRFCFYVGICFYCRNYFEKIRK